MTDDTSKPPKKDTANEEWARLRKEGLAPWRLPIVSGFIDLLAFAVWWLRWRFRALYLWTNWIPWPIRLVGWAMLWWAVARSVLSGRIRPLDPQWWRELWWWVCDGVAAAPSWIDRLVAGTPAALGDAILNAPGELPAILGLVTLAVLIAGLIVMVRDLRREIVVIEPFSMPADLVAQGHTGEAVVRRIIAETDMLSAKAHRNWGPLPSSMMGDRPDINLPGARLSLRRLTQVLRQVLLGVVPLRWMFGVQPERVIIGAVTVVGSAGSSGGQAPSYELSIAVRGWPGVSAKHTAKTLQTLAEFAAKQVIEFVDPRRSMALTDKADMEEAKAILHRARARAASCPWPQTPRDQRRLDSLTADLAFLSSRAPNHRGVLIEDMLRKTRWIGLSADGWAQTSLLLLKSGNYHAGRAALLRDLALAPEDKTSHYNLGLCNGHLDAFKACIRWSDRALKFDHNYAEAYGNKATAQKELGELDNALENGLRALECNPEYGNAHHCLSEVCVKKAKAATEPDLAMEWAQRAIDHATAYGRLEPDQDDGPDLLKAAKASLRAARKRARTKSSTKAAG